MGTSSEHDPVGSPIAMGRPFRRKIFFRRQLIVNSKFQLLLLSYTLLTMLSTAAFIMVMAAVIRNDLTSAGFVWIIGVLGFAIFAMLILAGFWLSNLVVGPIYRMEMHMKALVNGEPAAPLKFRDGDHFQELAVIYNELLRVCGKLRGNK